MGQCIPGLHLELRTRPPNQWLGTEALGTIELVKPAVDKGFAPQPQSTVFERFWRNLTPRATDRPPGDRAEERS